MKTACNHARLRAALADNLRPDDEQILAEHLEECDECSAALEQLAGGETWRQQAAALLTPDDLDADVDSHDGWSAIDFTVEHLEPADEPGVLGRLNGYDVLEIIGHGGMGVVLKAFDRDLKRCVAIKVLAPHLAQSTLAKKRFAREAQAAAAVVHPNVLAIHQVQPSGRLPFLVMPLVCGESLADRLAARGTLELDEILRIGMQAAAGLAAAHEQGLVHRDVKPANILLEKGVERAVLTDFGLARAADDVALTRYGVIAGTPQYMSPEQARGEALDGRSDLFGLGCVLYEMASGVSPFRADSLLATMRRLVDGTPQSLSALQPDLPPWFVGIVERLLRKDPAERFASAQEVAGLLEACLAHVQQPAGVPLPLAARASQPCGALCGWFTNRRITGVLAMIATLGLFLLGGFVFFADPPDIAGDWTGEEWGKVALKKSADGEYTGTYTDTFGKEPGELELKWSRIERRFNGTWREGDKRHGEISVRLVDGEIRGAHSTDGSSKINPGTPHLADLEWKRARYTDLTIDPDLRVDAKPPIEYRLDDTGRRNDAEWINIVRPKPEPKYHLRARNKFRYAAKSRVEAVAFSPDGTVMAIGGEAGKVMLFNATKGDPLVRNDNAPAVLPVFTDIELMMAMMAGLDFEHVEVRSLSFSPDGKRLAIGTSFGQVKVYEVNSGKLLYSLDDVDRTPEKAESLPKELALPLAQGNVWNVAFSPDGKLLATCGDAINYEPGNRRLGRGPTDGLIKLWNAEDGKLKQRLDGEFSSQVTDMAFSSDGNTLATVGHWPTGAGVKFWDVSTGKVQRTLESPGANLGGGSPLSLCYSGDGKRMAVGLMQYDKSTDVTSGSINCYFVASGIMDLSWKTPRSVRPIAFSPDGNWIAAITGATGLTLYDAATGEPAAAIGVQFSTSKHRIETFAFSPDGKSIVVAGMDSADGGFVELFSLETAVLVNQKR